MPTAIDIDPNDAGEIVADRLTVALDDGAPVQLGSGGWVFTATLCAEGVNAYGEVGHVDYVPADTLRDPAFLDALAGLPVIDDDQRLHRREVTPADIANGADIGRILSAWWDEEANAIRAKIVIDKPRGIEAVKGRKIRGVSIGYRVWRVMERGKWRGVVYTRRQVRRAKPTHITITLNPRDRAGWINADAHGGTRMNPNLIAILAALNVARSVEGDAAPLNALANAIEELAGLNAAHRESIAALEADAATAAESLAELDTIRGERDTLQAQIEADAAADVSMTFGQARQLQSVADALGIEIGDGMSGADAIKAVMGKIAGSDEPAEEVEGDALDQIAQYVQIRNQAAAAGLITIAPPRKGGGSNTDNEPLPRRGH